MTYHEKMLKCPKCKTKTLRTWESFDHWTDPNSDDPYWYAMLRIWEWQCVVCLYWKAQFNLNNGDDFVKIA